MGQDGFRHSREKVPDTALIVGNPRVLRRLGVDSRPDVLPAEALVSPS
jgi:hypothetical protein